MRSKIFLILLAIFLLAACGYDPEQPIYDTKANPENFPELALTLIDMFDQSTGWSNMSLPVSRLDITSV